MKPGGRIAKITQRAKNAGKKAMAIITMASIGAAGAQVPLVRKPAENLKKQAVSAPSSGETEIPSLRQRWKTGRLNVEEVPELRRLQKTLSKALYDIWDIEEKKAVLGNGKQRFFLKFRNDRLPIGQADAAGRFSAMLSSAKSREKKILVYKAFASYCAVLHEIDPGLAVSVMKTESHYNPEAVSSVGAKGLMQVLPESESYVKRKKLHKVFSGGEKPGIDSELYNIETGVALLAHYIGQMESVGMGAFAYNVGPNAAARLGKEGMEKSNFMRKLMEEYTETFGPYFREKGADVYLKRLGAS